MAVTSSETVIKTKHIAPTQNTESQLNKSTQRITVKDLDGLDIKIVDWSAAQLSDFILVLQEVQAKAAVEFA